MISGHNTDILHDGTVYHVQTEDKGRSNPVIESLIYVGGQVVVSKQESYADLLEQNLGDQAIAERMDRQHRVLMAAIKSGRFDEQFKALLDSGEVLVSSDRPSAEEEISAVVDAIDKEVEPQKSVTDSAIERARLKAVEGRRPLDEMVLEYLKAEKSRERLVLAMEENGGLALGSTASLALRATSSKTGQAVNGAVVTVKLISTVQEPTVLSEGKTEHGGEVLLSFEIPKVDGGSAALIVSAASPIGRAELKHLL
jgi:acyl-CoA synthetase (AMP-forming)/AMP-acid ligase II